ncbi:MAG: UDP-N-acetylmuramoyl-L-alanyl-D-glutamate--2,6-diaminopimelate ligase [Bacteroidales bacterium]|nr:UDP-N-acetylmuramoyl-L-alanyl-D-glutamate--2,6-diaminopimelate ligase [Bacteroidales bacterium]
MKTLAGILQGIEVTRLTGDGNVAVGNIRFDSRQVEHGDVFVAVKGTQVDGHDYIEQALEKGAVCVIAEQIPAIGRNVAFVKVKNSAKALGIAASNYFDRPSAKLKLVGVTGTNGKTTVVTLLHQLYRLMGNNSGFLSTIRNMIIDEEFEATHTTPDPVRINRILNDMVIAGCSHAFMEVSSHAVDQFRIEGLHFAGGIFTNITHDHLDYHKTFGAYLNAKKAFFDQLPAGAFALTNADDKNGNYILQNTKANKHGYSLKSMADFKGRIIENHFDGLLIKINGRELWTPLVGEFNAYNIMAVYGTALLMEEETGEVLEKISQLKPARGRFEYVKSTRGKVGIVDYAHTPDALENVLKTIYKLRRTDQLIITVIGAGGDRDKKKRPLMAKIAAKYSDQVLFTSDNPRSEDPEQIIADMKEGLSGNENIKVLSVTNRMEAIKTACMLAGNDDIILVAGKGHETYQEIKGVRHSFDDKAVLKEILHNE